MAKTGAVVIDVSINRLPDGSITGVVDLEGVRQRASYITPIPGGVGPMTVTMLIEHDRLGRTRRYANPTVSERTSRRWLTSI